MIHRRHGHGHILRRVWASVAVVEAVVEGPERLSWLLVAGVSVPVPPATVLPIPIYPFSNDGDAVIVFGPLPVVSFRLVPHGPGDILVVPVSVRRVIPFSASPDFDFLEGHRAHWRAGHILQDLDARMGANDRGTGDRRLRRPPRAP